MLLLTLLLACHPRPVVRHASGGHEGRVLTLVPSAPSGPVVVVLHADGADFRTMPKALRDEAEAAGWVLLGLESPGPVDSGCWWSPHKGERSAWLSEVVTEALGIPGTDPSQVVLAGWSGGAFFAAGVPFHLDLPFSGGIVGVCGGDLPREDSPTDWCAMDETLDDPVLAVPSEREAAVVTGWRAHFTTTRDDPWTPRVQEAAAYWEHLGARVALVDAGPGDHCALDVEAALEVGIRAVLEADSPTPPGR